MKTTRLRITRYTISLTILFLLTIVLQTTAPSPILAQAGTIMRISIASDGTEGNNASWGGSISSNGRYVAFQSGASNLVPGDTNRYDDVFVHDCQTRETTCISIASDGTEGNNASWGGSISSDGRYVAFQSRASNIVLDDTNNYCYPANSNCSDIFVHDRQTEETTRVSVASDEMEGNSASEYPSISADGRYVAFLSGASNLVPGDTNGYDDAFVHDRQMEETTRISVASDGTEGNGLVWGTIISADGRYVVFGSSSSNLVLDDTNNKWDIFVHDRQMEETTRISVASDDTEGNDHSRYSGMSISADGRYVAFGSYASNLIPNDTNSECDIFVHNRQTGETTRVSVATDGTEGNADSWGATTSADGRYVVFSSRASNFVPDDTNDKMDIFVRDCQMEETMRISVTSDGIEGNEESYPGYISADGHYVVFSSFASNLVPNDTNGMTDAFVYDLGGEAIPTPPAPEIPGQPARDTPPMEPGVPYISEVDKGNYENNFVLNGAAPGFCVNNTYEVQQFSIWLA